MRKPIIAPGHDARRIARETKIPLPTLRRAEAGAARLSAGSLQKIKNFYRRENYATARALGDSVKEARKVSALPLYKIDLYVTNRRRGDDFNDSLQAVKLPESQYIKYSKARETLPPRESRDVSKLPDKEFKNHIYLRNRGAMRELAENYRDESRALVKDVGGKLYEIARTLARNNRVPLKHILDGMRRSDRTDDDWEQYVKERSGERWRPQQKIYDSKPHNKDMVKPDGMYEYLPEDSEDYNEWRDRLEAGYYD